MKRSREPIKAELLKRFEQEVDELLDWQEKSQAPNLSQFEAEILAARKELSIAPLEELLQEEEQREPVEAPRCETCGRAMEGKGKQPQVIETRVGTLRCGWSEGVARQAVKLSGQVSYGDAAEILQEIGQIRISKSSVWRLTRTWGKCSRHRKPKKQIARLVRSHPHG